MEIMDIDVEKVLKGFEHCSDGPFGDGYCYVREFPYYQDGCELELKSDAAAIIRSQAERIRELEKERQAARAGQKG